MKVVGQSRLSNSASALKAEAGLSQRDAVQPPWGGKKEAVFFFGLESVDIIRKSNKSSISSSPQRSLGSARRRDNGRRRQTKNRCKRWRRQHQRSPQIQGALLHDQLPLLASVVLSLFCFCTFFYDKSACCLSTLFSCCVLAAFNDLFNIYHS